MEKKKHLHTDPNTQVHSEFETTIGNSFKAVRKETPASNKEEADKDDPLNQLPGNEYAAINEWDIEEEPVKMSAESKQSDKIPLVIGLLGVIGLIGLVISLRANRVTS
jgi:hypothetical protein